MVTIRLSSLGSRFVSLEWARTRNAIDDSLLSQLAYEHERANEQMRGEISEEDGI